MLPYSHQSSRVLYIVLLMLVGCAHLSDTRVAERSPISDSDMVGVVGRSGGVELEVRAKAVSRNGESVVVNVSLRNDDANAMWLGHTEDESDFYMQVQDEEANYVPMTPYGIHNLGWSPNKNYYRNRPITIAPRGELARSYDLFKYFTFNRPGVYRLTVKREFETKAGMSEIDAGPLTFRIQERKTEGDGREN